MAWLKKLNEDGMESTGLPYTTFELPYAKPYAGV
jgi:hypothetical protein